MKSLPVSVLLDGTSVKTCGTLTSRSSPELYGQTHVFDCENVRGNAVKLFIAADSTIFMTVAEIVIYRAGDNFCGYII